MVSKKNAFNVYLASNIESSFLFMNNTQILTSVNLSKVIVNSHTEVNLLLNKKNQF